MTDIRDEVTSNSIDPALFGKVVDDDEDGARTEWRNSHTKLEQFSSQWWTANAHFLFAWIAIVSDSGDEMGDVGNGYLTAIHQTEGRRT